MTERELTPAEQNVMHSALRRSVTIVEPPALAARDAEIARLREALNYVDTWVSNPAAAYSTAALEGFFAITRELTKRALPYPAQRRMK